MKTATVSAEDKILKAKSFFIRKHPFYSTLILGMPIEKDDSFPCIAGTDGVKMYYNSKLMGDITQEEVIGVLAHELMHIVFMHCIRRQWRQPMAWNVAADYIINEIITEQGFKLPKEVLRHEKSVKNQSAEELYEQAKVRVQFISSGGSTGEDKSGRNQTGDGSGQGNGKPKTGDGKGGGFSPKSLIGDVRDHPAAKSGDQSQVKQAELEAQLKITQAAVTAKMAGKLPANLERLVEEMNEPKLDWRELLRRFFDISTKNDFSWKKPNRRYIHEGIYLPSMYSEGLSDLVVGVDTSGSIGQNEINAFFTEILTIMEDNPIENLHIISCDSRAYPPATFNKDSLPKTGEEFSKVLRGGGGTAFGPVFKMVEDMQIPCRALVYLTDLCGSDFGDRPDYPVMWVTTHSTQAPWGEIIKIQV